MTDTIIWWTGATVLTLLIIVAAAAVLILFYAKFIHGRFEFRFGKTERAISIATWAQGRLISKTDPQPEWQVDDWPVRRPFYISYEHHGRRLFLMFCVLDQRRPNALSGKNHPDTPKE